jgi:hypothetical protein
MTEMNSYYIQVAQLQFEYTYESDKIYLDRYDLIMDQDGVKTMSS